MGPKVSTTREGLSGSAREVRSELISRIHVLDRTVDTVRFQYAKPHRGSRNAECYSAVIVFQNGKRHHSSQFHDDRDFMFYTIFQCLESWTTAVRTNSKYKGLLDGSPRTKAELRVQKTNSSSPRLQREDSSRLEHEASPRKDSPRLVKVHSQADMLREVRPSKTHARLIESRIAVREYEDRTKYSSPNKEEIITLVKQLVGDLIISGDVPAFVMKITAYDTGLVPASQFPYYLNFRSNNHSSLSAQLMYHLQWYRQILSVSPVLDIRLSIADLVGVRPDRGSPYTPLEKEPEDPNTPSWYYNGLLNLHPTLLEDLFTFETVLMCIPVGSRSDLVFPKGTVLCRDTSQNLEKILAENPVLRARVKEAKGN